MPIHRRDFIKGTSIAAATVAMSTSATPKAKASSMSDGKPLIIDFHAHPTFSDFSHGEDVDLSKLPPDFKLDVLANPGDMGIAMALTSMQYKGKVPVTLSTDEYIEHLDANGVSLINFLCPIVKGQSAKESNERNAKIIGKFNGRAMGSAGFDPNAGKQAIYDIEYAVKELGFKGLKMIGSLLDLDINDRAFYPCFEKAQELGVPITVHTGAGIVMGCRVSQVKPILIDDVAFDFPGLKINCAHLGCWDFMDMHSMLMRHKNVYSDLSAWPLDAKFMELVPWGLLEETVSDKLFLGSDYPAAQTSGQAIAAVNSLPVSDAFKGKILGKNAANFLGLT